jgi:formylglycine-generating enzyme required for sulfatase activity
LVKVSAQKTLASLGPSGATKAQLILDLGGGVRMEFLYIKPGVFTMGGREAPTEGWQRDERPPHKVEITRGYYLGKYEVTQGQWEAVMGSNPSKWRGPELPVEQVSWEDCQNFLREINKKAKNQLRGRVVALPTEAQWEYACRAGTTTRYCSGDSEEDLKVVGWYGGNSGRRLHAVGELEPNDWGLYDMHGNVLEWCEDDWVANYKGAVHQPGDGLRVEPVGDGFRVVRGGYFVSEARVARSASRSGAPPGGRWSYVGFRPAQGHHQ